MNCFGKNVYPMLSVFISFSFFPFLAYFLAISLDLKIIGIAISVFAMNLITFGVMMVLFWWDKDLTEAFQKPTT